MGNCKTSDLALFTASKLSNPIIWKRQSLFEASLQTKNQCWALPQIVPLIRKLRTQGFGLRICEPISYRKHLRIFGKKIEIYRKSANQQHHWDRFFAIFKNIRFYDSMYRQIWVDVFIRGGVEDTRLEANAKDPKKSRDQGQGQGHKKISRPRTDPLEAKDQGHRRKCSSRKKVFKKIFQATSKKRSSKKFFRRKRSSNFFFRRFPLEENKKRSSQIFCEVSGAFQQNFNVSKIVLSSSRGQGNFRGLEASRRRPRTSKCVLEAKNVLEDSTFGIYKVQHPLQSSSAVERLFSMSAASLAAKWVSLMRQEASNRLFC